MSELEEIAELLKLRDELRKEVALMERKYREALRDQEILKEILENLKEENRRLRRGREWSI
ncbi:hypothetical protein JCM16138_15530 [Thermococcus atlanticus]